REKMLYPRPPILPSKKGGEKQPSLTRIAVACRQCGDYIDRTRVSPYIAFSWRCATSSFYPTNDCVRSPGQWSKSATKSERWSPICLRPCTTHLASASRRFRSAFRRG